MNAVRWALLQNIVEAAATLPANERAPFLVQQTDGDLGLRLEVEDMLRVYDVTGSFLEDSIGMAAALIATGSELQAGTRVGPYSVVGVLGHGGMGTVYRAQRADREFRQDVAIKLVRTITGANDELFRRFRAERQMLANINHPHIARLLDGGITEDGLPYLVMEYVDGVPLDTWIKQHAPCVTARLTLFGKVCSAIEYAHQNLIVHRDLKPGNILITADGTPKLLDFGIAKLLGQELAEDDGALLTRPAERLMTPEYASPEQIRGDRITTATDVYGLGVLLYEILTGVRPFRLNNVSPAEAERLVCETQPRPPSSMSLDFTETKGRPATARLARLRQQTDLDRIVLKALHKLPARRYNSAAAFSADVQRYLQGFPVEARPDSLGYRSSKFVLRHRLAVAAAVLVLVTVVALSINLAVQARRAQREAASADAVSSYLTGLFEFTRPDATQGRSVSARDILDSGSAQLTKGWKGDPSVKGRLLNTVGIVYYQLGALDRARPMLMEAQAIQQRLQESRSPEALQTATVLGDLLTDKGDYSHAEAEYTAVLHLQQAMHGPNGFETADALDGLARLHWTMGDFAQAEALQKQAIRIAERKLPPTDDLVMIFKNNYEATLADSGDFRTAEPLARELLDTRIRQYGLHNSSTVTSMNNYGFLLVKTGRLHAASVLRDQTLTVRRELYGKEHPEIAMSLVSSGWIKRELGELEAAKALTQEGLEMAMRLEGPDSLDTSFDEDAYGLVLLALHQPREARQWVQKALAVRLGKPSPSQPLLAQSYDHLGLIDLQEGAFASARTNLENSLKMRERFYQHPTDSIAESLNHLGRLDFLQRRADEAGQAYRRALGICQANFGSDPHLLTAEALDGLASVASLQGLTTEATQLSAQAQDMRVRTRTRD